MNDLQHHDTKTVATAQPVYRFGYNSGVQQENVQAAEPTKELSYAQNANKGRRNERKEQKRVKRPIERDSSSRKQERQWIRQTCAQKRDRDSEVKRIKDYVSIEVSSEHHTKEVKREMAVPDKGALKDIA